MPSKNGALVSTAVWGPQAGGPELEAALLAVLADPQPGQLQSAGVSAPSAFSWLHVYDVVSWAMSACKKGGFAYNLSCGNKFPGRNWRRAAYLWLHNLVPDLVPNSPTSFQPGFDQTLMMALERQWVRFNDQLASERKRKPLAVAEAVQPSPVNPKSFKEQAPWCCSLPVGVLQGSAISAAFDAASEVLNDQPISNQPTAIEPASNQPAAVQSPAGQPPLHATSPLATSTMAAQNAVDTPCLPATSIQLDISI